ncbi:MAG: TolC family protein [Candidatus Hydrogenedentes bacterium]|nr:TolC family protein [Candidatus Hydrogenedentota bacterium]
MTTGFDMAVRTDEHLFRRGASRRPAAWWGVPFLVVAVASCTTFDPPERGTEGLPLPESYALYETAAPAPDRWWEGFESEELERLVAEALEGNFTLQQTYARLLQAGALAKQTRAARWPSLSFTGDASVSRAHTDTGESGIDWDTVQQKSSAVNSLLSSLGSGSSTSAATGTGSIVETIQSALENAKSNVQTAQGQLQALDTLLADAPSSTSTVTTESYQFGLASSYELDLWGRLRANDKAAQLEWDASLEDVRTVRQSLVSEVVLSWLELLLYKQTLLVVEDQLDTNQTTLELIELRYRKGQASALDIFQQRQVVAEAQAAIPPLEANIQLLEHELAVLSGNPPRTALGLSDEGFPAMTPLPAIGLPADLLARRPDVRAAGLMLQAADWAVSAARADRLPSVQLTASAAYGAEEWDLVFSNWIATLAGSVTGPIFDAGRRKAEVARTRAVVDERLAAYKEAVVTAVKEVEDALVLETKQREYVEAVGVQLDVAQANYDQAIARYLKGLNDYLPVLSALTNLQALQRTIVQAKHDLLVYRVTLHRSLGGSWVNEVTLAKEG